MILKDLVCLLHSDLLHGGLPLQDGGHGHQTTKLWLAEEILEGTYVVTYVGILLVSRMTSRRKLFLQTHVCESGNGHIKSLKVNISVFVVLLCMYSSLGVGRNSTVGKAIPTPSDSRNWMDLD